MRRAIPPGTNRLAADMSTFDPQEFGRLQAQVEQLLEANRINSETLATMSTALQAIQLQMAEAKGGWRTLMMIGGGAATLGGALTAAVQHLLGKGPT